MSEIQKSTPGLLLPVTYRPSEVIGLFSEALARKTNGIVHVRGIYHPGKGIQYGGAYYDLLRDELSSKELTIIVSSEIRSHLSDGNLVDIKGFVDRKISNDCSVKLQLNVTGMDIVQEQTISEDDRRRIEIRSAKAKAGFKNVDGILEAAIYADRRPSVGLVYAQTSITDKDFDAGKKAAGVMIDFWEYRATFTRPDEFIRILRQADENGHDCVCIIRGGGAGLEALEDLSILYCVASMRTPVITAVGHTPDKVFINEIADLEKETPSLLGTYFKDIVESVAKKKADSTAALSKKIEAQFKEELEAAKKQNADLQKRLDELNKGNAEDRKKDREQLSSLEKQVKTLSETSKTQSESFNRRLKEMQEENKTLTIRVTQEKERKETLERELREAQNKTGGTGLIIAVIILAILLVISLIAR